MTSVITWLEAIVGTLPLPLLEVWGRFSYLAGLVLAICAFGGLTFRIGDRWGFGRERLTWDTRAFLSVPLTSVLIIGEKLGIRYEHGPAVQEAVLSGHYAAGRVSLSQHLHTLPPDRSISCATPRSRAGPGGWSRWPISAASFGRRVGGDSSAGSRFPVRRARIRPASENPR